MPAYSGSPGFSAQRNAMDSSVEPALGRNRNQRQILRRCLLGPVILCIDAHDRPWQQRADRGKECGNAQPEQEVPKKTPPHLRTVFLPQILRDHDPGGRADSGDHNRIHGRKFSRQPDARHAGLAQLADHDLVNHTE